MNGHDHSRHARMMLAWCMVPMIALVTISVFKVPTSTVLMAGLVLLCPLSHLLMMKFLTNGHSAERAVEKDQRGTVLDDEKERSAF